MDIALTMKLKLISNHIKNVTLNMTKICSTLALLFRKHGYKLLTSNLNKYEKILKYILALIRIASK